MRAFHDTSFHDYACDANVRLFRLRTTFSRPHFAAPDVLAVCRAFLRFEVA